MEKLYFTPGERDLVLLEQRIEYRDPKGRNFIKSSILVEEGIVGEETAIAKTTGLPIAMGAEMVLEGLFKKPGLFIPVLPELYQRLLERLDEEGIRLVEKVTMID
jgi:saccharopine dehydrogenase-like NADP-dependent oxidoreductase